MADERGDLLQVVGPNPGRQDGLVGVSVGRIHQQQALVFTDRLGEPLGTVTEQDVTKTQRRVSYKIKGEKSKRCIDLKHSR